MPPHPAIQPQQVLRTVHLDLMYNTFFAPTVPFNPVRVSVGTPFSRFFDVWPQGTAPRTKIDAYRTVEFWAKFRYNCPEEAPITAIHLILSDSLGNIFAYPLNYSTLAPVNEWFVGYFKKTFTPEEEERWDNRNLRANLIFVGPVSSSGPQTGLVILNSVEWLAVQLTDAYEVEEN